MSRPHAADTAAYTLMRRKMKHCCSLLLRAVFLLCLGISTALCTSAAAVCGCCPPDTACTCCCSGKSTVAPLENISENGRCTCAMSRHTGANTAVASDYSFSIKKNPAPLYARRVDSRRACDGRHTKALFAGSTAPVSPPLFLLNSSLLL